MLLRGEAGWRLMEFKKEQTKGETRETVGKRSAAAASALNRKLHHHTIEGRRSMTLPTKTLDGEHSDAAETEALRTRDLKTGHRGPSLKIFSSSSINHTVHHVHTHSVPLFWPGATGGGYFSPRCPLRTIARAQGHTRCRRFPHPQSHRRRRRRCSRSRRSHGHSQVLPVDLRALSQPQPRRARA